MPRSFLLVLAASLLAPVAGGQPAAPFPDYRPVAGWPQLPPGLALGPVSAVATDAADRVYVAHRGPRPVLVFDRDGTFLRSWGDDHLHTPHGLRVDPAGNVWVTDLGHHLVMKFDPAGKLLLTLGQKGRAGAAAGQFDRPTDVAVTPGGDFYVTDGYGNARVQKYDAAGKLLKEWGTKGKGEGEFNLPHAVCLDAAGRVYVGDRENNRVQVFDTAGRFVAPWRESGAPYGLFRAGDRLFVADGRANCVRVLGPDGQSLGRFGEKGTAAGQFQMPHMLCVDSRGDVYVAEVTNKRVQKFTARAAEGDAAEDVAFVARVDRTEQRYVVVRPKGFDPKRANTAVVALHGHGSDRWQFVRQDRGECKGTRDVAAARGFLLVAPDYRAKTSWMGPAAEADVLQILDELKEKYGVRRVVVAGGSMGGTAALAFAALHPDRVAGCVSLNGTANLVEYENFAAEIAASYGGTRKDRPEVYRSRSAELHAARLTMPVAMTTGGKDTVVPPDSCLRLGAKLKQLGRPVTLIHRPDGGHATTYDDTVTALTAVIERLPKAGAGPGR